MKVKTRDMKKTAIILGSAGVILLLLYFIFALFFEGHLIFKQREKIFTEAVEKYFLHFEKRLPSKEGDAVSVTLQELYNISQIKEVYIPKTGKLCSAANSWVKVIKEGTDNYKYYTYLECGKYRSRVDSIGPEITLEGEDPFYVKIGSTYEDPGIKSVYDKENGDLDKTKVKIDTSNVDMKKIGEYVVKYTAYDNLKNRTDITRKVYVTRNVLDEVKEKTDNSNIYKGQDVNNHILYSGMLWRIVKVNDDNTLKLVLDDNVTNLSYGKEEDAFENSNIAKWLTDVFYPTLKNTETYVKKDSIWCQNIVSTVSDRKTTCDTQSKEMPVGILTLSEFFQSMDSSGGTYLNTQLSSWLLDQSDESNAYIIYGYHSDVVIPYYKTSLVGVKPVINLNTEKAYIVSGNGTGLNPYKLNDYTYGEDNQLLNARYIGEYIDYSGQIFRIIGFDENGNTKLISAGPILNNTTNKALLTSYNNEDLIKKFDPYQEGNLGYQLNNEFLNYINDTLLTEHEIRVPIYEAGKYYTEFQTETKKAKISIPASYELFSGSNNNEMFATINYWLLDSVLNDNHALMLNTKNGTAFDILLDDFKNNANKIIVSMKKTTKLASGRGTVNSPYYVK